MNKLPNYSKFEEGKIVSKADYDGYNMEDRYESHVLSNYSPQEHQEIIKKTQEWKKTLLVEAQMIAKAKKWPEQTIESIAGKFYAFYENIPLTSEQLQMLDSVRENLAYSFIEAISGPTCINKVQIPAGNTSVDCLQKLVLENDDYIEIWDFFCKIAIHTEVHLWVHFD